MFLVRVHPWFLRALNGNSITVSNSIATGNGVGVHTDGGKVDLFHSVVTKNSKGIETNSGSVRMGYSSVVGNGTGVSTGSGLVHSMGNNMIMDNDIDVAGTNNFITFLPR